MTSGIEFILSIGESNFLEKSLLNLFAFISFFPKVINVVTSNDKKRNFGH